MTPPHILFCDDDPRLRELLTAFLTRNDLRVSTACDAQGARALAAALIFDLMIFDVMLGAEDGFSLLRGMRAQPHTAQVPILMLSALGEAENRIRGLREGADDYLAKPFEPQELLLRIYALLRRSRPVAPARGETIAGGVYDAERGTLTAPDGTVTVLTGNENRMLSLLISGETVGRDVLEEGGDSRTLDVAVARLRKKLGDDGNTARRILTVRGKGYRLIRD